MNEENQNSDFEDFLPDPNLNEEDQLRIDNELKKLKIEMNGGKILGGNFLGELPPEIENQFLNNILAFEEQFRKNGDITIGEKLGNPEFLAPSDLTDEAINTEIEHIEKMLFEHGIMISAKYSVNPRDYYSFISNRFLEEKVSNITIKGMINHFVYEDFIPNPPEQIREVARDWAKALVEMDLEAMEDSFTMEAWENEKAFWALFLEWYQKIEIFGMQEPTLKIEENNATIEINGSIICTLIDSKEKNTISGIWNLEFEKVGDKMFFLKKVNIPNQKSLE